MAKSPIEVKGIRRIMDALGDEVNEGAKTAVKLQKAAGSKVTQMSRGKVEIEGIFGFDKEGRFGLAGKVAGDIPGQPATAEVGAELDRSWQSEGAGTVRATFEILVTVEPEGGGS